MGSERKRKSRSRSRRKRIGGIVATSSLRNAKGKQRQMLCRTCWRCLCSLRCLYHWRHHVRAHFCHCCSTSSWIWLRRPTALRSHLLPRWLCAGHLPADCAPANCATFSLQISGRSLLPVCRSLLLSIALARARRAKQKASKTIKVSVCSSGDQSALCAFVSFHVALSLCMLIMDLPSRRSFYY